MNEVQPDASSSDDMAFELAVLEDVSREADRYWRNFMWRRVQPGFHPSAELRARFEPRYGSGGVEEAWRRWFAVLTSFDYADAVLGHELPLAFRAFERGLNRIKS